MDEENLDFGKGSGGVFITNEGNFMFGNASLSYYDPQTKTVNNDVFSRANGIALGDVAQSMTIYDGMGYIVVNKSGVIFVIDVETFKVVRTITGIVSPRYIHFVSGDKAYVTQLYSPLITVLDPRSGEVTGHIDTKGHKSTEQMVQWGRFVFVNCWSYDNKILVVDSDRDEVVDSIEVGLQPTSIAVDKNDKLWVVTDGGYEGNPLGWENPALFRIDAATRRIEKKITLEKGDGASELCMNGMRDTLYFISKSVWKMGVEEERLPLRPFLKYSGTIFYGLAVDPRSSEVYVADAIDYSQAGVVYRYSPQAEQIDVFRVGITPGAFCFKP